MPFEKGLGLHFSFENHTPPDWVEFTLNTNKRSVLSLLEIGAVILEKKIFICCWYFPYFLKLFPLEKGVFESLPKGAFAKFGWNWPSGSGNDDVTDRRTENGRTWHLIKMKKKRSHSLILDLDISVKCHQKLNMIFLSICPLINLDSGKLSVDMSM